MKCKKLIATAAAATTALLAGLAGAPMAAAEPFDGEQDATARILSVVNRPGSDVALVTVEYTCYDVGPFDHLWVSVKQGGHDLEGEGSSQRARAWYDSHPGQDAAPNDQAAPTCDGTKQTQTFEVFRHAEGKQLNRSTAWVQFCLVQFGEGEPDPETGEPPVAEFLSENQWTKVQAAPSVR